MHSRISRFFRVCPVTAFVVTLAQCSTAQEGQTVGTGSGTTEYLRAEPVGPTELFPTPTAMNIPVDSAEINGAARFLAGMPSASASGDAFDPLRKSGSWKSHQNRMNALWRDFEARHGNPVVLWAQTEIDDLRSAPAVLYPFSGPDFLFANLFFPKAETFVMCGLEPCEALPDWNTLSEGQVATGLQGLSGALNTILQLSYFITKDMRQDFQSTRFRGVLPVFLVFIARTGHVVESINAVQLDAGGNPLVFAPATTGTVPGFLIRIKGRHGSKRLFYFSQDLSNGGCKPDGPFLRFASSLGKPVAFAKSASYLMHEAYFSNIRDHILTQCRGLVQDPSGIPYRKILDQGWTVDLYGKYRNTLNLFRSYEQPDLVSAYDQQPDRPLSFGIGYLVNPATTCLMVGRPQ